MNVDPHAPPQSVEAEQAVLGSMLLSPADAIPKALNLLRSEDFYQDAHRRIYQTITGLFKRNEPVDLIMVTDRLRDSGHLEEVGGAGYVTALLNSVPTAANVEYYVRIVQRHSLRRHLARSCEIAVHDLRTKEPEEVVRSLQASLVDQETPNGDRSGLVVAPELRAEPVSYAIHELVPKGTLTLLSGRDKRGKTLFALEMLRAVRRGESFLGRFAVERGLVAGFFLDDPEGLTVERLDQVGLRNDPQVFISTSRRSNLADPIAFLRDTERRLQEIRPVLVVIDALYLLVPTSRDAANDQARMAPLMGRLNVLAESTGAAVLVVAHDSKSGLDVAGSHVIRAAAKTILRLLLPQGSEEDPDEGPTTPRRVLRVESKLAPAASWALELRGVGQWVFLGTQRAAREATVQGLVRDYLAAGNAGTVEEIAEAVNRRRIDVEQAFAALKETGEAVVEDQKPSGRGRPRKVYRAASNFRPNPIFRPEPPDGKSDAKPRVHQGVSTSTEFPSGQIFPREGRWDGNSAPEHFQRTGEDADFNRLVGPAKDLFGGEVVYDGRPKTGPWGISLERGLGIALMRMGSDLGWPAVPKIGLGQGMQAWRKSVLISSDEQLTQALGTLDHLEDELTFLRRWNQRALLKPEGPCASCHSTHFWRSRSGEFSCAVCYPPGDLDLVMEWMALVSGPSANSTLAKDWANSTTDNARTHEPWHSETSFGACAVQAARVAAVMAARAVAEGARNRSNFEQQTIDLSDCADSEGHPDHEY